MSQENQSLTTKLGDAEKSLSQTKLEVKEKSDKMHEMELKWVAERGTLETRLAQVEGNVLARDTDLSNTKQKLSESLESISTLEKKRIENENDLKSKDKEIVNFKSKLKDIEQQLSQKSKDFDSKQKEHDVSSKNFESKLHQQKLDFEKLDYEHKTLQGKFEEVSLSFDNTNKKLEDMIQKNKEIENEKIVLEKIETELLQKTEDLSGQINSLNVKAKEEESRFQEQLSEKDKMIEAVRVEMKGAQDSSAKEILDITEKLQQSMKAMEDVQTNLSCEITSKSQLNDELVALQMEQSKLNGVLEQKDDVLKELQSKLEVGCVLFYHILFH